MTSSNQQATCCASAVRSIKRAGTIRSVSADMTLESGLIRYRSRLVIAVHRKLDELDSAAGIKEEDVRIRKLNVERLRKHNGVGR
jgi:hypothetical protein